MTVKLANGTEFEGTAAVSRYDLLLTTSIENAQQHLIDFNNKELMATIEFYFGAYKNVYKGYNKFGHLEIEPSSSTAKIWMHGNEDSSQEIEIPTVPVQYLPKSK